MNWRFSTERCVPEPAWPAGLGGFLGALMTINLWLGLYRSSAEWPWTYFFLIIIQIVFVIQTPGGAHKR
jgi:hypothetical protein